MILETREFSDKIFKKYYENINTLVTLCPLVCSKADAEVENDSAIPPASSSIIGELSYREVRGVAAGSIDMREFMSSESSSGYTKSVPVPVTGRFLPEIRVDHSDDIDLENYSTSPRKYQEPPTVFVDPNFSARGSRVNDVVTYGGVNDCCSFRNEYRGDGKIFLPVASVSPECPPAKVLCSADVESRLGAMPDVTLAVKSDVELSSRTNTELKNREHVVSAIPDIANTSERKQPDGEEKTPEIVVTGNCDSTTSGMLDRISHDLDYLLNRTHAKEGA